MIEPRISELSFNIALMETLSLIDKALKDNSPLHITTNEIALVNSGKNLATFTKTDIQIAGQSFQNILVTSQDKKTAPFTQKLSTFLERISPALTRLNHLGVSYHCEDTKTEALKIKGLAQKENIPLSQEPSESSDEKWLFLGDTTNWENPLFEVVLNQGSHSHDEIWIPHVQIDVDTTLSIDEIRKLTNQILGNGFIKWELEIPDYGTVLAMGLLGRVGNTKIALGIGTNLRGTEYHRKNILKQI